MSMRGGSRKERDTIRVSSRDFAWDRAVVATLRHSSLLFGDCAATPLAAIRELGSRDRLSLLGQFAAHQAFLQFAGITDGDVDAAEWAVVRKRGADCRLLRIAAKGVADDAPPLFTLAQQFAELVGAELSVLRQSWARAEAVYLVAHARLRGDVAADLQWLRRAACGRIASPGPDALRGLRPGRYSYADDECVESLRALDDVIVLEGASPFPPYAALRTLGTFSGGESEVGERILAANRSRTFVVTRWEAFDAPSRSVVEMLIATGGSAWVMPHGGTPLPETRHFVLSPRLSARRALEERLTAQWAEAFVMSDDYDAYLDYGELPPDVAFPIAEPRRSYIGALALLGTCVPRELATRFLGEFLFKQPLEELAVDGLTSVDDEAFVFASESVRAQAERSIPAASRPALCRVAASLATGVRAALLSIDAGDVGRAAELLEQVEWSSADACIATLRRVPHAALTPRVAKTYADALNAAGRYREARDLATLLTDDDRELVLAKAERRMGDYTPALARLERLATRPFDAEIVRAELLRLLGRDAESRAVLAACTPTNDEEAVRLAYEQGRGDDIPAEHYFASRLATYHALDDRRHEDASRHAAESLERARCASERVDAWLDRVFAAFSAGRWLDARTLAMQALAEIEETQGDRAAGGILFTLAYLAADDGQWTHAAQRIARLRRFYSGTQDERRLRELSLLAAQLDFARGRFADARREAAAVLADRDHDQILEAAALIVDEIDRIEGRNTRLRSDGRSGNVELTRRREALISGAEPEDDGTRTAKLKRFRWALARGRREIAEEIARELDLTLDPPRTPGDAELHILRAAATREFPFAPHDFDVPWCYATRNRLGNWIHVGQTILSVPPSQENRQDCLFHTDKELLYFEGSSTWSDESRESVAAIFRTRAENHRLRRIVEQEEHVAPRRVDSVDGIVGQSPAIRDVHALVQRVAKRDVPVCILGESGTGKELIARAIHRNSSRRTKTFTAVNCAALPENLIESELFGHVRGAFTGADRDRAGLIETTDGGTLFLDEIGEMPLTAQAKLLRFLQEGEFRRVGDTTNRSVDVRIVSATNRKLESAVEEGRFREDLYYRIRGVEIALPPLRDRAADIPLLVTHFLASERDKHRGGAVKLSSDAEALFLAYSWPGNVRELQNTIRGAHAMAGDAKEIDVDHLPERVRQVAPQRAVAGSYQDAVTRFKRDLIERSLAEAKGNQNQAASLLRMSRQALAYQIRELGILVRKPAGAL